MVCHEGPCYGLESERLLVYEPGFFLLKGSFKIERAPNINHQLTCVVH